MKKINLLPLIIILVVVLSGIQLIISQRLVLAGERVHSLNEERSLLEREEEVLLEQVNETRCLRQVQARAEAMGMIKTASVVFLKNQESVAWHL